MNNQPPKRKSVYNDISHPDAKINSITETQIAPPVDKVKKPSKRKNKTYEVLESHSPESEPIIEPKPIIHEEPELVQTISVWQGTSNFNKFMSTLKFYIEKQEVADLDLLLQLYLNVYKLEKQFDTLLEALQGYLKVAPEQSIIQLIKVYYDWTTGNMIQTIQEYPYKKNWYDNIISIISKHSSDK